MTRLRAPDYQRVSSIMLLRLAPEGAQPEERSRLLRRAKESPADEGVEWGSSKATIRDVLSIINDRRKRDDRPLMDERELEGAIRAYLNGKRKDPLVEEYSDALSSLREARLGINKHPLIEGLQKTA